ncbi:MAG: hypothetical protein LAT63_10565 [Marinobacter sp.]|nr:hypothetical protein [Marinobacter sp.]
MSLGSLLIQPQRIQRPMPDPWVAVAQDVIKLTITLVEDANAEGPLAGKLPALMGNLEQRLKAQAEQGLPQAMQRIQRHFQGMVRFVDDFNRNNGGATDGTEILALVTSFIERLRSLSNGLTEASIQQQLDIFRVIMEDDFGISAEFLTQQLSAMLDDLITAWQALPSHISAKSRRRRTLAIETVKRLKRQLNQNIDINLFNTQPLARELYQALQNVKNDGLFQQLDCYLGKVEDVLSTLTDISEVMPALTAGSTVGSQFRWFDNGYAYCWYPSFLLSSQSLPLLAITDVKDKHAFLTLFRIRNSGDNRVDALARHIYDNMPGWLRIKVDSATTGDAAKDLLTELVGHINHLMMTGTLNQNRRINTPLVTVTFQDASNNRSLERQSQVIDREFRLAGLNFTGFTNGPMLVTVSTNNMAGNRIDQQRRFALALEDSALINHIEQKPMAPFGDDFDLAVGSIGLPGGQRGFVVVRDRFGACLPVIQRELNQDGNFFVMDMNWMGFAEDELTITSMAPDPNGVIRNTSTIYSYTNHETRLTLTLTVHDDHTASLHGETQDVAAGTEVNLSLRDERNNSAPLDTVTVAADGSFALSGINLDNLVDGPIQVIASVNNIHDIPLTNGSRAVLRRAEPELTMTLSIDNNADRVHVTGNLSGVPAGRYVILKLSGPQSSALPLVQVATDSNGNFQGTFLDMRGIPSGNINVDAWSLDAFGTPITLQRSGSYNAPASQIQLSIEVTAFGAATVTGGTGDIAIQETPFPFAIISGTTLHLPDHFSELSADIPNGKLFYYNRRLLEEILRDRIEHYTDNCGTKIANYLAKKVEWKKHSVYIKNDHEGNSRYVMCDKMPIYIQPPGVVGSAEWHNSDLFFDKYTSRTPAKGSLHFTFDAVDPIGCEILTFVMMLLYDATSPVFTMIDGFSPGHEGGEIANTIWDSLHWGLKIGTVKPINGYKSLGAFGTWLNSSGIGPKAMITLIASAQGHHSEATAGNQFWFWVTMVLGDFIRPNTHSTPLKLTKKILKYVFKATISITTQINAKHTGSDNPDLPTIKPSNYKIKDGIDDGIEFLFTWMMFLPYSPDYHSIGQWHRAGHWDKRVPFFLWWFLVAPATGALSGLLASGIRMGVARSWSWKYWGESAGWGALNMGAYFLFKEYAHVEGKTGFGISSGTHARTGSYTGYPPKSSSPYRLPYAYGTSLYMGQGNNGLFSHNTISNINDEEDTGQWQFYAFDFGHDHRELVHAMRAGDVWDMRESEEDNSEDRWNFITIRHLDDELSDAHDDPFGTGTPRITYAIYGHGAEDGISNVLGADIVTIRNASDPTHADWGRTPTRVLQGQAIMEADDTGTSFHSHLHVYVVLERDATVTVNDPVTGDPVDVPPGPGTDSIPLVFYDVKDKYCGVPKFLTWHESKNEAPE